MVWILWFVLLGFFKGRGSLVLRMISVQAINNAYLFLRNSVFFTDFKKLLKLLIWQKLLTVRLSATKRRTLKGEYSVKNMRNVFRH